MLCNEITLIFTYIGILTSFLWIPNQGSYGKQQQIMSNTAWSCDCIRPVASTLSKELLADWSQWTIIPLYLIPLSSHTTVFPQHFTACSFLSSSSIQTDVMLFKIIIYLKAKINSTTLFDVCFYLDIYFGDFWSMEIFIFLSCVLLIL